jgi:hypothetical protein
MIGVILNGIGIAVLLIASIVIHEIGHYAAIALIIKRPVEFKLNFKYAAWRLDLTGISRQKKIIVYWAGVVGGLLPLYAITDLYISNQIVSVIMLCWYLIGCRDDFKQIFRITFTKNPLEN